MLLSLNLVNIIQGKLPKISSWFEKHSEILFVVSTILLQRVMAEYIFSNQVKNNE
jgi:hypothetical protein